MTSIDNIDELIRHCCEEGSVCDMYLLLLLWYRNFFV